MPHKAECCFVCKQRYDSHGNGKDSKGKPCKSFEFVAVSARNDKDILFSVPGFQSSSSAKTYTVSAWRQGDYSCNCTGWRNWRTCEHIKQVSANPEFYKKQAGKVVGGSSSVVGTVDLLTAEMAAMEAAVKRGDPIELAALQGKIDYHRTMFETASAGLVERFAQVQANIKRHILGEEKIAQPSPSVPSVTQNVVSDSDDPFGD